MNAQPKFDVSFQSCFGNSVVDIHTKDSVANMYLSYYP